MIIGAGFAGLIAAHIFPKEPIVEAAEGPMQMHKALLRFRSDVVSRLTGIPFKQVKVRKGIWNNGAPQLPSIQLANMYSQKCLGTLLGDRSIWSLEPADRFIAPESFYEQLIDQLGGRINWGVKYDYSVPPPSQDAVIISTTPLPLVLDSLALTPPLPLLRSSVTVRRYRVSDTSVYQTIYYPTTEHNLYRASISGDLLICEFAGPGEPCGGWEADMFASFGFHWKTKVDFIDEVNQRFGKIAPIDEGVRKALIHRLTLDNQIYSLGRFATWRNLLLDDIVADSEVIKRLIRASDYDKKLINV